MPGLDVLDQRGAVHVLLALGRREPMRLKDFTAAGSLAKDTANRLLADLELVGLVTRVEEPIRGASKNVMIKLTPLGREVARNLDAIDKALTTHREYPARDSRR